jgi:hypothetical protein
MSNGMLWRMLSTVLASLLLPMSTQAAVNQLANPGFEAPDATSGDVNTLTGWNAFGWDQLHWITQRTTPNSGAQCLKLYGPWDQYGGVGAAQIFPAQPGQTWIASIWALNSSGDRMQNNNFCTMKIEFQDINHGPPGGTWLAGVNVFEERLADVTTPLDVWTLHGLGTAPAPPGTAYANFVIVEVQMGNPISGGSVFLDDAFFNEVCGVHQPAFDLNDDGAVDNADFDAFMACWTGPAIPLATDTAQDCKCIDRNADQVIDQRDFGIFQRCYTGSGGPADPACDD